MTTQTTDEWTEEYNDRFGYKLTRGDDSIRMKEPRLMADKPDQYEVIGRLGDEVYHTVHDDESEAMERVRVLQGLADYEQSFETDDEVYVFDPSFSPVIRRGTVSWVDDEQDELTVLFVESPFATDNGSRSVVTAQSQAVHVDADITELLTAVGLTEALHPDDFGDV